jgi:hypothetical protein
MFRLRLRKRNVQPSRLGCLLDHRGVLGFQAIAKEPRSGRRQPGPNQRHPSDKVPGRAPARTVDCRIGFTLTLSRGYTGAKWNFTLTFSAPLAQVILIFGESLQGEVDFATYCKSEQLIGTLELPMRNANSTETFPLKDFYTTPARC